jgi:hypothetical protein
MDPWPATVVKPSSYLELRHASTDRPIFVVVPPRRFLAIDGIGRPEASGYGEAALLLRTVAEWLRERRSRSGLPVATRIGVLECLWWPPTELSPEDIPDAFADRSGWHWRLMVEIPLPVTDEEAALAIEEGHRIQGGAEALIHSVALTEGPVAQLLHVGGHATMPETVRRLFDAVTVAGLTARGSIHALHVADADRVPPERARCIVRIPVTRDQPT